MYERSESRLLQRIAQLPPERQLRVTYLDADLLIERRDNTVVALRAASRHVSVSEVLEACNGTQWQALSIRDALYVCAWRRPPIFDEDWLAELAQASLGFEFHREAQ